MNRQATARVGMVLGLVIVLTGCTDPKDTKIMSLERQNAALSDQLSAAELARDNAMNENESSAQRIARLQQDLSSAQARAARAESRPPLTITQPAPQPERRPEASGWEAVPGGAKIAIADSLLFDSGKSALKPNAKSVLDRVVSDIRSRYPNKDILVFGHTDSDPIKKSGWKDNYELSTQRSLSVVRFLKSAGIPGDRLVAAGCGEYRPQAPNKSRADKAKNRRVEIFAVDKDRSAYALATD